MKPVRAKASTLVITVSATRTTMEAGASTGTSARSIRIAGHMVSASTSMEQRCRASSATAIWVGLDRVAIRVSTQPIAYFYLNNFNLNYLVNRIADQVNRH